MAGVSDSSCDPELVGLENRNNNFNNISNSGRDSLNIDSSTMNSNSQSCPNNSSNNNNNRNNRSTPSSTATFTSISRTSLNMVRNTSASNRKPFLSPPGIPPLHQSFITSSALRSPPRTSCFGLPLRFVFNLAFALLLLSLLPFSPQTPNTLVHQQQPKYHRATNLVLPTDSLPNSLIDPGYSHPNSDYFQLGFPKSQLNLENSHLKSQNGDEVPCNVAQEPTSATENQEPNSRDLFKLGATLPYAPNKISSTTTSMLGTFDVLTSLHNLNTILKCLFITTTTAAASSTSGRGSWLGRSSLLAVAEANNVDYVYDSNNYDYDYGDPNAQYDDDTSGAQSRSSKFQHHSMTGDAGPSTGGAVPHSAAVGDQRGPLLPLCCPKGTVFDYVRCSPPSPRRGGTWLPHLQGAPSAAFTYGDGFPRCRSQQPAELYQSEVFFDNATLILPRYVPTPTAGPHQYCVVTVEDQLSTEPTCPKFDTKVYVCVEETVYGGAVWLLVGVGHVLLVVVLTAFIALPDLRALQGQYLICFVLSLLLFNILLFPVSVLSVAISEVSCIALRAIKYFFFCGVFLWFNVICFDVWRTVRAGCDISGRRRFFIYSLYTWIVGAVLTTAVLVLKILKSGTAATAAAGPAAAAKAMVATAAADGGDSNTALPICHLDLPVHIVLQMVQGVTLLMNAVLLSLTLAGLCTYSKLGNGLPRSDASLCVKQCLKLFIVMVFHALLNVSPQYIDIYFMQVWQFTVLECVSVFGILVYRRSVLKQLVRRLCRCCGGVGGVARRGGGASGSLNSINGASVGRNGGAGGCVSGAAVPLHHQQQQQYIVPEKIRLSSV